MRIKFLMPAQSASRKNSPKEIREGEPEPVFEMTDDMLARQLEGHVTVVLKEAR